MQGPFGPNKTNLPTYLGGASQWEQTPYPGRSRNPVIRPVLPRMCMASDSDPLARCLELKDSGNAALKVGDTAEAIRMYEEAASLAEAHPDKSVLAAVCSNLSAALLRAERAEEALVAAGRSVGARVDWSKAHFRRGEAAFALRQYKEARESYRHAAELDAKEIKEAHGASAVPQRADKSLSAAVAVCDEAMRAGSWLRKLLH